MLQILRKSVSSWVGILILALALGALVFTLFQPSTPGSTSGQSGAVLATVGKGAIQESDYLGAVDRAVARERERAPQLTNPEFLAAGGGEMVLQQLIAGKAMNSFGAANGMAISRRMVDGEIASIPAFQLNGKFDEPTFRRLLAEQRISEEELRESIATDLMRRQLLQPVLAGTSVPRAMAEPYAALLLEQRSGVILPIPSAAMPDPGKATDAQLQAFHTENKAAYTLPERRAFRFAEFNGASLRDKAKPTAEAVRKYYDDNPLEFGGLEMRNVQQVVLPDEAAAKAFVAEVRGGKDFGLAAAALGFEEGDVALGALSQDQLAQQVNAQSAKAAFALAADAVSEPVKSGFGWHVLHVREIQAPQPQPFTMVQNVIEKKLEDEKLAELLSETVGKAEDQFAEGQSLADVAKGLGAAVQTSPALTADGRLFDENYGATRVMQPLLSKVFATEPGEGPQVVEAEGGNYALVEVTDVVAPALVPLDKIRGDVEMAWSVKSRSDAAKAEAERIAAAASKGETLQKAIGGRNLPAPQQLTVRRLELTQMAQQGQQVPPPVVMLLNTPKGQARVIQAPGGQGWFVVKVEDVKPGAPEEAVQLVDAVRQSLVRDAGNEMAESFVRAIERDVGVVRKPDAVKAVNRRLTGATVE
ncbi:peptidyl-prolyl cis-trans isomerase [Sandaracinobacter sp. RS1-74]|uniref:peptidylprolyl isomerase n=1 Tax=Sandaracinobacteroides sayramensis TaxID=2913411 RepID=UPI001EDA447A|nr:peptidylprolyl isomerase [Sandaracinobacteroides sayramensis]MCG2841662.1 peptidyl-prolyl cis-trans isomerase [Sandaracinobacteroides sayramensis]